MPDITFFTKARLRSGYEEFATHEPSKAPESLMLGDWQFYLTRRKPVDGNVGNGRFDFIGYEETYSNPLISQEETDTLMQKYREETGQTNGG